MLPACTADMFNAPNIRLPRYDQVVMEITEIRQGPNLNSGDRFCRPTSNWEKIIRSATLSFCHSICLYISAFFAEDMKLG